MVHGAIVVVAALLTLAAAGALCAAVEALAVLLEAVGLLAVAGPLDIGHLNGVPILLLDLPLVLAPCTFTNLRTLSS